MRKPRPTQSQTATLTEKQLLHLNRLLFDENRTYAEVAGIMKAQHGVALSAGSLGAYYKKISRLNMNFALVSATQRSSVHASGVEVTIRCQQPGQIRLAINPLREGGSVETTGAGATVVQADGAEIDVLCQQPGEIRLAVRAKRGAAPEKPGGSPP